MKSIRIVVAMAMGLSMAASLCWGQTKQWDKRFGGGNRDELEGVQQTRDGGYILYGSSYSGADGDKTESSRGFVGADTDFWIVKVDSAGVKQWDKRFGGSGDDRLASLQQTTDGGYILGGYSYSGTGGDKSETSRGKADYWIVKVDAAGSRLWDRRFGGSENDFCFSVRQTTDGGYILGGYSYSGAGGDKSESSRGDADFWIVKVNATGTKEWDKRYGALSSEQLMCVRQTADGGYILGGRSTSWAGGDKTESARGFTDYWIVKVDNAGAKQWDRNFGGSQEDLLNVIERTPDGGYILGGTSYSGAGGDITEGTRGATDYWVVKVNAGGTKQWDRRFGGADSDYLASIQPTPDGGFLLGGSSHSGISGDKTQAPRGGRDYWIVKINAKGRKVWDKCFGGSLWDTAGGLWRTSDGGCILGGFSASGADGDKTEGTRGETDYWVVKVSLLPDDFEPDPSLATAKLILNGQTQVRTIHVRGNRDWAKFKIGPRGARNLLVKTSGGAGDTQLGLFDSRGKCLAVDDDSGKGRFSQIRRASLPAGTYFIRVQEKGNNAAITAYRLYAKWTPQ